MLSFELSAIDLILAIAVIILIILQVKKPSVKTSTKEELLVGKEEPSRRPTMEDERPERVIERLAPEAHTDSMTCPYGFGYLRKLSKDASIPDKCLSCSRIVECYSAER